MCTLLRRVFDHVGWTFFGNGICKGATNQMLMDANSRSLIDCQDLCSGDCSYVSYRPERNGNLCYGFTSCETNNNFDPYKTYFKG